ncbi:uncharacterized protein LOC132036558 [Lycium ferocissimum]|uniref:uncharacterized protein LOC132036558 n=1 Tax=Lycium ferocissimum TaxID=112874 RepID=UPI002815C4A7|nr:uncharacterized protein LOC132036558 [Lycium ferocissimum]
MAKECKFTINGRFLKTRPQIETIRATVKESIPIKGKIQIGVYDNQNVFIHVYNEEDFNTIYFGHVIDIDGQTMWLSRWTPNFTPEEDNPLTLVTQKRRNIVAKILKFQQNVFPINYLGCPLFYGKKRVHYFTDIVTKIIQRMGS